MITNVLGHCYHDDFLSTFKGADYRAFTNDPDAAVEADGPFPDGMFRFEKYMK